jgi:small nuclear ribonucleoprotein (snRNP)-like protein
MIDNENKCNLFLSDVFEKTKALKNCKNEELYIITFNNVLELKALLNTYNSE